MAGATHQSVQVWRDLMVVHAAVVDELASALDSGHGLSVSEFDVLVNLDPRTPTRHGDLADRVILSRTALTRLVDRLAARGLVERQPDPQDHRAVRIALTDTGRTLRRNAARTNARIVRRRFGRLSPAELAVLDRAIQRLGSTDASAPTDPTTAADPTTAVDPTALADRTTATDPTTAADPTTAVNATTAAGDGDPGTGAGGIPRTTPTTHEGALT